MLRLDTPSAEQPFREEKPYHDEKPTRDDRFVTPARYEPPGRYETPSYDHPVYEPPPRDEISRNGTPRNGGTPRTDTPAYTESRAPIFGMSPEPEPVMEPEFAPSITDADEQGRRGKNKKKKNTKDAICYNCRQRGHWKGDCPHPNHENALTINTVNGISVREPPRPPSVNGNNNSLSWGSNSAELGFSSADGLLDYVTTRWQERFVMTDVHNEAILDQLSRRPFFMLVSVDAPLTVRHARFRALHNPHCTIESFALASDTHLYDPQEGLQPLISRATVRLLNTSSSLAHLYATLGKLNLADPVRLRPSWDAYFMSLATLASLRSNCMKRRVGAVLVGREKRVISTGYNGTPRGLQNCSDGGCSRCNSGNSSGVGLATCLCIHAEENALLEAGRERIRDGAVLYCDTCPCLTCSIKICQVGINEVVYAQGYSMDDQTAAVFHQAGVKLRQYIPPPNGLIHLENLDRNKYMS
ncbi:cytidine and deoxycytidylate deaminase zinc-binding region [Colletotrichum karsti]|uniref:Deoxycytidylate deaminase n=1 Tax=Colletotrichum karsti TaxID=1095194 RepID=A0A9P6LN83_9PEZI|nr:cytidine and deoxycytidylate deaminase zinc-binding region [Colletotrichum karsti]KAF9882269.1 cytidine and deoxycytidylate deaminase zinc-binding region [Colletotrichum karsti]